MQILNNDQLVAGTVYLMMYYLQDGHLSTADSGVFVAIDNNGFPIFAYNDSVVHRNPRYFHYLINNDHNRILLNNIVNNHNGNMIYNEVLANIVNNHNGNMILNNIVNNHNGNMIVNDNTIATKNYNDRAISEKALVLSSDYVDPIDHEYFEDSEIVYCITQNNNKFVFRKDPLDQWFRSSRSYRNPMTNLEITDFSNSVKLHHAIII